METDNIIEETSFVKEEIEAVEIRKVKYQTTVKERLSCCLLGILLYFMDTMTVGRIGFGSIQGMDLQKYSSLLFVVGAISSQILFFVFSSFKMGLITTPISENFIAYGELSKSLHINNNLYGPQLFYTVIAFITISTFLTSLVFFTLYLLGFQRVLEKIPKEIGTVLFFVIGCLCCVYGNASMIDIGSKYSSATKYLIIASYSAGGLGLWVLSQHIGKRYPSFGPFSYFVNFLFLTALSYIPIFFFWGGVEEARAAGFLPSQGKNLMALFDLPLFHEFSLDRIQWSLIFNANGFLKIAGIVLINLVQFPINIPAITTGCSVKSSTEKELLSNGFSNMFSTIFGGFSTYVVSSSTIAYNRNKVSTKKIDGLALVFIFSVLYILGQTFFSFVPQACLDMLLLFIGFDILKDSIITVWNEGAYSIFFTVCVALPTLYTQDLPIGLCIGILLSFLCCMVKKYVPSIYPF
ncbi:hypothetical protein NEMIN01_1304 [Nematocida minor]|uniref:uncharacterized protein n=1 Tax=Nematocida minor TaxID=1912983 RepID=UPI00222017BC|nr:uncharacterized protein NEMIN01_1304 [Nematocida minor]KAI5190971.1 hypothetical protein NEMIN01_1304 [Nematocida minor]